MRKLISIIFIVLLLILSIKNVGALEQNVAGPSASIVNNLVPTSDNNASNFVLKKKAIRSLLQKYNSPLVDEVDTFLVACQKYNLDCYLLPSIMGIESYFGQMIYPGTYNGFGWGGGMIYLDSWEESIMTVAKGLRENYYNRGAVTIYDIGRIYAPPSTTWASKVTHFMNQFEYEESQITPVVLPL